MHRKKEERHKNFSSEFRNAFAVKNKCEQLKLEKQHKSLERLRAHENLKLLNKRKEILNLQSSILSSKTDDDTQGQEGGHSPPVTNINGTRKAKFRSRAVSISAPSINSVLKNGAGKDDNRFFSESLNLDSLRKINHFKKMSRSKSISGGLDCFKQREFGDIGVPQSDHNNNEEPDSPGDDSSSRQAIWKLLPPIQLTPLYKQESKSVREISSNLLQQTRRFPVPRKSVSWNDLQDCRYLRCRWKDDS